MISAGLDFSTAALLRILDQNERFKFVAMLVKMKSDKQPEPVDSVILAEKTSFPSSEGITFDKLIGLSTAADSGLAFRIVDMNDIYYRFVIETSSSPAIKLTVIHPATPKHIAKYTKQERVLFGETPELYRSIVEPYIQSNPASRLQWVQNILEEKSEQESLIFADRNPETGFYLLPDSKWDKRNLSGIYLLAICKDPSIRSLRDLNGDKHLKLLEGIKRAVEEEVPKKFPGISGNQLRCFIHYQPTYYHFHVHIIHIDMADGTGALVGQAYLLEDVIDNLKTFGPDFYQKKTLTYQLGRNHELLKLLNL